MQIANNILLVRMPDLEPGSVREVRDYILESVERGVLVLAEDASYEVMQLPPLGGVEIAAAGGETVSPPEAGPLAEAEPQALPFDVYLLGGRGASEKREIQKRLIAYRKEHGLGCRDAEAKVCKGNPGADDLRDMCNGTAVLPIAVWRRADNALKRADEPNG